MLPKIISIKKTVSRRLEEYQNLLEDVENPCSDVVDIWASIFEELTIIGVNWQALWILTEDSCRKYNLVFPTAVIVKVNDFNWKDLMANVSVVAVQEDIILPSALDVQVIELHPIADQEYDDIELRNTEDWLDKCRYFFRNLWYPWDAKINVSFKDWCEKHLENRLFMQSDMKNGVFDKPIVNYMKLLLLEAQSMNFTSGKSFNKHEDEKLATVKRYIRRKILKTELDLFEKPELRQGMILLKTNEKHLKRSDKSSLTPEARFVWTRGNFECLVENLKLAQTFISNDVNLMVCSSFQEALDASSTNDMVILSKGLHLMNKFSGIDGGGTIKGVDAECTSICPDITALPRAILFECCGDIHFENLTITATSVIAIQVFNGIVKLTNCRLESKFNSASKGIVVVSGGKLCLEGCHLEGFCTGITLQKGSEASLLNTKITNCNIGIKVSDEAYFAVQNVDISMCSTFGVCIESTENNLEVPVVGSYELLSRKDICKISNDALTFSGNGKGNVILKKAGNVEPSPEVICISDDGEYISDEDTDDSQESDVDNMIVTLEKTL
ncbi:hypothetical protein RUM43_009069 [Polyplax serrata]|uniref:Right handed beta helix domain-containing protein n=1 Tax=Polyplax serrata TaxID=468196 RepID=A0AAN8NVD6_POLSC